MQHNFWTRLFRSYFRAAVVYDFDEDEAVFADKPHMFVFHPHGVVSAGLWSNAKKTLGQKCCEK